MSTDHETNRSLQWLIGIALVDADEPLPMMACASKSALRVAERADGAATADIEPLDRSRPGLRLIFNDDHGMTPTVTLVNQTAEAVALRAVRPSVLATEKGTYDLDALLASGPRRVEPGHPLVIRITDIGRNVDEPLRVGSSSSGALEAKVPTKGARSLDEPGEGDRPRRTTG